MPEESFVSFFGSISLRDLAVVLRFHEGMHRLCVELSNLRVHAMSENTALTHQHLGHLLVHADFDRVRSLLFTYIYSLLQLHPVADFRIGPGSLEGLRV